MKIRVGGRLISALSVSGHTRPSHLGHPGRSRFRFRLRLRLYISSLTTMTTLSVSQFLFQSCVQLMQDNWAIALAVIKPVTRLRSRPVVLRSAPGELIPVADGACTSALYVWPPRVHVLIDSSNEKTKCITNGFLVFCATDTRHLGNGINGYQVGDTLENTTNDAQVCSMRTDSTAGWGMHLEIACVAACDVTTEPAPAPALALAPASAPAPPVHILIDNSYDNIECVTSSVAVISADDAGHLGNRANSH